MKLLKNWLRDDRGQDLIEYSLIMAFVALSSAALFINAGGSTAQIWSQANAALQTQKSGNGCPSPSYSTSFPADSEKACFNPDTQSFGPAPR